MSRESDLRLKLKLSDVFVASFQLTTQQFQLILELWTTLFTLVRWTLHGQPSDNMQAVHSHTIPHSTEQRIQLILFVPTGLPSQA